jgi:RNA polymerase sigma factor for flagellar operon FliA
MQKEEFQRHLAEAIDELPEREKLVINLYYDEEFNLREIGEILGVSESRISQLMGQAHLRIRGMLLDD